METPTYRTMTQIAIDSIKDMIISGIYPPGTRLIPQKLEVELNLGRVAIREALRDLQGQGLVMSEPNKGVVVAMGIDLTEILEIFQIRYELEGRATELAAMKISEAEIDKLERLNFDLAGFSEDTHEYLLLNRKFHMDFYRASQLNFLCQLIRQIYDRIVAWRSMNYYRGKKIPEFLKAHQEMLNAARDRDGKKARQVVIEHLRSGYDSFVDLKKSRENKP
ncbi:MAG: GntR family transcriptional regulator [Desulfobaccales bacterium]|jgi:DNA-binding GntR family transcriptional regulator